MSTTTTNYGLTKPDGDDLAQISVLNTNFDTIDSQMKTNADDIDTVEQGLSGKQDTLTFDDTPTYGSTNPVTSGGAYNAIAGKQDTLTAGDNITIDGSEISSEHYDVDVVSDTTSTQTVESASTITIVDSVTRDDLGHVEKINTKTVTMPTIDTTLDEESTNLVTNGTVAAAINDIMELTGFDADDVVGVQIDFENQTFTRLAGAVGLSAGSDFDSFNPFGGRKRCNLSDAGVVNAYYGDSGYVEDGSNGQVMVEQPKYWYKVVPLKMEKNTTSSGSKGYKLRKANYFVSATPKTGFKLHPAFVDADGNERDYYYIGAFEACLYDTSASAYISDDSGVMDTSADLLSSIAGVRPASGYAQNYTRPNVETLATNRGTGWHGLYTQIAMSEFLLMFIEGAGNLQNVFGAGVSSQSSDTSDSCAAFTGSTSGNASMVATSTIDYNGTAQTSSGKLAMSYRGCENEYGNIWKFVYGMNIWGDGTMDGGEPYVCSDPSHFAESTNSGYYEGAGFTVTNASGWINAFAYGKEEFDWMLMANEVGGNSSLPIGDYAYVTANLNAYRIARLGGYWSNGATCGLYWTLDGGVGNRGRRLAARLVFAD